MTYTIQVAPKQDTIIMQMSPDYFMGLYINYGDMIGMMFRI